MSDTVSETPVDGLGPQEPADPPPAQTARHRLHTGVVIAGAATLMVVVVAAGMFAVNSVAGGSPDRTGDDSTELTSSGLESTGGVETPEMVVAPDLATDTATTDPSGTETTTASPTATGTTNKADSSGRKSTKKSTGAAASTTGTTTTTTTAAAEQVTTSVGVIRNQGNDLCVDLTGRDSVDENAVVQQHYCNSGTVDNQMFQTISNNNGSTFLLQNVKSQWCLDVNGSGSVDANIVVNTHTCYFGSQDNQMFRKKSSGSGFYLVNVKSGLCMGVSYADDGEDEIKQPLILASCGDSGGRDVWSFG